MDRINKNYLVLTIIIILSLILVSSFSSGYLFSNPSICPHYRLFGVQCPFCGLLRAVNCFLKLDFASAWKYNYNVFLLALLFPVFIMQIFTSKKWIKKIERIILIVLAVGFSLIYILRIANL
jgi:Protein of unknown function (DUF2752)